MKIKSKLSLTLLLIVLVPLILGMVTLYQSSKSSIQAIQESSAQRYASTVRDRLAAYFDKWKVTVDSISRMPSVKAQDWLTIKEALSPVSAKYPEARAFAMSTVDGNYWYEPIAGNPAHDYLVTDNDADPTAKPKNLSHLAWHKDVVVNNPHHEDKQTVSDMYIAVAEGIKLMAISSAIHNDNGQVIGAFCISMSTDTLNHQADVMLSDFQELFDTNSLLIITSTDEDIMYHYEYDQKTKRYRNFSDDPLKIEEVAALPADVKNAISTIRTKGATLDTFQWNKHDAYIARSAVEGTPYTVYLMVPEATLLSTLQSIRFIAIIMTVVSAVIVIVASFFISGQFTKPILQVDDVLEHLAAGTGDLGIRMDESRKD